MGIENGSSSAQFAQLLTSVRRSLSSNDFDDGFSIVMHSEKKKNQSIVSDGVAGVSQETVASALPQTIMTNPVSEQATIQAPCPGAPLPLPVQPFPVPNDSIRYALSRFPFSPFQIRFNTNHVITRVPNQG